MKLSRIDKENINTMMQLICWTLLVVAFIGCLIVGYLVYA